MALAARASEADRRRRSLSGEGARDCRQLSNACPRNRGRRRLLRQWLSPDQTEVWNAKIAVRRSPGAQEERSSSALLTNCSSTLNQNCAAKLMAILLYCIAKRDVQVRTSLTGIAGDPVVRAETGPLATFTSHNADS